ncbi:hypothetical protein [Aquimarina sediminis]|uniref:hypothetical protein n=1 Tax=Aquimarina sediminis TaxID=2070536 RepID=UPI000CA088DC|nr:hypothetical protein [Aquimarina sediminis]
MYLKNFSKYKIDKELLSKINAGGHGLVICGNGESFSAPAESEDSVDRGGERWCRDRGGVIGSVYLD